MYASPYQRESISSEKEPVYDGSTTWKKGEQQPSAYKDAKFAILFILHIAAVFAVSALYGMDAYKKYVNEIGSSAGGEDGAVDTDYSGLSKAAAATGVVSLLASSLMLSVMIRFASVLIKMSLLFSIVTSLAWCIFSFRSGSTILGFMGLLYFALTTCYACSVWSRIPFGRANLETSLSAVKTNFGISLTGYFFSVAAFGWTLLWGIALLGVYDISPEQAGCNNGFIVDEDNQTTPCVKQVNMGYMFLLLLSFYWTHQVLMNVVHTSVAGMVGTWWFAPEEAVGCCSSAVTSSVYRSCTYSFGSICFGSLLVAIIQTLRQLADYSRNDDDMKMIACVIDCILGLIEDIVRYFNKWAFVYVGLYGYAYVDAGKNVMTLFQERGWETIITFDLVDRALTFASFTFGLVMGGFCMLLEMSSDWFEVFGDDAAQLVAFAFGFLVGILVSGVTLNIVSSAVNATIVLFAEAPSEFASNHPALSSKMRSAYLEFYPGCM